MYNLLSHETFACAMKLLVRLFGSTRCTTTGRAFELIHDTTQHRGQLRCQAQVGELSLINAADYRQSHLL